MKPETKQQVTEQLEKVKRELLEALRIAGSDEPSRHLIKSLKTMVLECEKQQGRLI